MEVVVFGQGVEVCEVHLEEVEGTEGAEGGHGGQLSGSNAVGSD